MKRWSGQNHIQREMFILPDLRIPDPTVTYPAVVRRRVSVEVHQRLTECDRHVVEAEEHSDQYLVPPRLAQASQKLV